MKSKAFTLIELLVVIAIIGILASVVIASLNSARTKGKHASIKANLRNAIAQSNIYFNENGTYTGLCSDPTIQSILAALGGTGNAACYVHPTTIQDIDWGIATTYDGTHFTADPAGVLQLDSANTGGVQTWDTGMTACANLGKRMSGGSAFKALYDITSGAPSGIILSSFWSTTQHPTIPASAFSVDVYNGSFTFGAKSGARHIRCGF